MIQGVVQGVGFRPFIFNLAKRFNLSGWISNTNEGVLIEAQGDPGILNNFQKSIATDKPKIASISDIKIQQLPVKTNEKDFSIRKSHSQSKPNTIVLPDLSTCQECLQDILTPGNRRYRYPFTNCTNCGPRFSIIEQLPYDRKNTTMKNFVMCSECQKEYNDPSNRRFHAQPNACSQCGPQLELWDSNGNQIAEKDSAIDHVCNLIKEGAIVAIKGIGGFQLIVDATNEISIENLRTRKRRKDKPFALMYPNLEMVKQHCHVSDIEEQLLASQQAPIVLLKSISTPSRNISPDNPYSGVMLPYTPLHHLLLNQLHSPVIATSGNRSEEPICIDEKESLKDLEGIADYFLVHNRPIAQYVDDSIVRIIAQRKLILRRARGYASLPITTSRRLPSALAVGGHLKNTVAIGRDNTIYVSQHIGDLENQKGCESFSKEINRLTSFYQIDPQIVVSDYHPDYYSTKFASQLNIPLRQCQHHVAHVYSCMAENKVSPPLLGISWDGTGYGLDGTIWGGEFFLINEDFSFKRIAYFRPFPLPCNEKAIREPRLSAIGMLYEIFGNDLFERKELPPIKTLTEPEKQNLKRILSSGFQSPKCSSIGRIFDAVCSLINQRHFSTFEGQAAMELEFLSDNHTSSITYSFRIQLDENGSYVIDWEQLILEIIEDLHSAKSKQEIAIKFHNTLAKIIIEIAERIEQKQVLLSGGVFQNKVLTEICISELKKNNYEPYWHEQIPPNDGGIALGQLYSLTEMNLEV